MISRSIRARGGLRWAHVPVLAYKEEGSHFKNITRQILFDAAQRFASQLRYFEIGPGGYSTLERHRHVHGVLVLYGQGRALVGDQVISLKPMDALYIPPLTWHQFQPDRGKRLGFLCMANCDRDRPERPHPKALRKIAKSKRCAGFIKV